MAVNNAGDTATYLTPAGNIAEAMGVVIMGGGGGTSEVEVTNFPATQAVTGPLTNAQLTAQGLATQATLEAVLTELQAITSALGTANGHLAQIETNTTP